MTVATAEGGDIDSAIELIAEVFVADPVVAALVSPDLPRRDRALRALIRADASPRGAVVDIASGADGAVVGATVWHRADAGSPALSARLQLAWYGGRGTVRALKEYDDTVRKIFPAENHWHLLNIVVSPQASGSGVGSTLLQHGLDRVDADAQSAVLEASTPDSARLYARHGFEELAVIEGGPAHGATLMRRPPGGTQ
ncbi:GNAT family N-acetyltransferase [Demequina flava]|uniref:GNAT family N-acetyltransferase n=1 Tax=Demequina flava TaxID=1095025 RepID=UPI000785740A|nr:GNAT family N-acetyltransferase [Demequina flava]